MPTQEKLQKAILELLIGKAASVSDTDGTTAPTGQNNDKYNASYNSEKSLPRHFTSKERIVRFPTVGMQQSVEPKLDPATNLPFFDINTSNQENFPIQGEKEEGGIDNVPLDQIDAASVAPHDYFHNPMLQSLLNSISVSLANSISEAVTKIIVAKIENNFTDFTIKFNPTADWTFSINLANGTVVPGGNGQLVNMTGQIKFNDEEHTHKCKIKFSDL